MQGAATACRMRQIAKEGTDWEEAPPAHTPHPKADVQPGVEKV